MNPSELFLAEITCLTYSRRRIMQMKRKNRWLKGRHIGNGLFVLKRVIWVVIMWMGERRICHVRSFITLPLPPSPRPRILDLRNVPFWLAYVGGMGKGNGWWSLGCLFWKSLCNLRVEVFFFYFCYLDSYHFWVGMFKKFNNLRFFFKIIN